MDNSQNISANAFDVHYNRVTEMVHCYAESVGLTREQVHNTEKNNWQWKNGSANIEVWIQKLNFANGTRRDFLRVFCPIMEIPLANPMAFYRRLLELNDLKLGIKFTLTPNSSKVWASFERDIKGIDYNELSTFISDFEYWADKLDDELKAEFPILN